jgi:hypothetical protein
LATFSLKVRVENPRDRQPWCSNGRKVVVSYSGVALAWGDVPGFCVQKKAERDLMLLPRGKGVGLSEGLRRHLTSAPCSLGLSATSQQYFSLKTNQPPAISQQYFSLRTN